MGHFGLPRRLIITHMFWSYQMIGISPIPSMWQILIEFHADEPLHEPYLRASFSKVEGIVVGRP